MTMGDGKGGNEKGKPRVLIGCSVTVSLVSVGVSIPRYTGVSRQTILTGL